MHQFYSTRLLMRPLLIEDFLTYQQLLQHPRITQFNPYMLTLLSEKQFSRWIKKLMRVTTNETAIHFALTLQSTKQFIGTLSLNNINHYHRVAEIGFWLGLPYWRQGYMSEALKALLQYNSTQLKLQRLEAFILQDNQASSNTLLRCGFKLEGVLHNKIYFQQQFHNIACYAYLQKANCVVDNP